MDQDESNKPSGTESRAVNSKRSLITELSSVLALVVSFAALSIGAIQTRLMQSQARASVWPYVSIGYNIDDDRRRHTVTDGGIVVVTTDDEPLIGPLSEDALKFEAEADRRGGGA